MMKKHFKSCKRQTTLDELLANCILEESHEESEDMLKDNNLISKWIGRV